MAAHLSMSPMGERRRILHVIDRLNGYGGARMLRQLAAHQAKCGNIVAIASFSAEQEILHGVELEGYGIQVRNLGRRWRLDPQGLRRLIQVDYEVRPDIIHCWDASSYLAVLVTFTGKNRPVIFSVDALQTGNIWTGQLLRFFRSRVAAFVASDESTTVWLMNKSCSANLTMIRSGVGAAPQSARSRDELRAQLELPTGAQTIAMAGPLERRKKTDEAIWHFELVRVLHENTRLLIFGDGPDRERLERFAEEVSDPGCIRFAGYRDDVRELLPAADVYWQLDASPTTPLALLEAQAAGVPVVASDIASHRAAVVHEETGLLVPYGVRAEVARATDRLLADRAFAEQLAKNAAVNVAANWAIDDSIAAYEGLYQKVLSGETR
jgi:glycosyltransferase involved in cell wall biosynthesis